LIKFLKTIWQLSVIKKEINNQNFHKAERLILSRQRLGHKITLLEKLYLENRQLLSQSPQISGLSTSSPAIKSSKTSPFFDLNPNFIDYIHQLFKYIEHDFAKIQCTGIEKPIFDEIEYYLVDFLEKEINKINLNEQCKKLEFFKAFDDLNNLKKGIDPTYDLILSPHVYLMQYFLENIYCNFLAIFLIYQSGELKQAPRILDIAAGPGTMLFGLILFIQSISRFDETNSFTCSYYSLEQQSNLQYRGLQFLRYYLSQIDFPVNAFYQFNTGNIFEYELYRQKLPQKFFDLIVISHCFFYDAEYREKSSHIYKTIFQESLSDNGRILLIIQCNKFYRLFDSFPTEDTNEELRLIKLFVESLGLKLIWYKLLTSTGMRTMDRKIFGQFAHGNLPKQNLIGEFRQQFFSTNFIPSYALDDFVIYAEVN
jgi:hypothetical protein